MKKILALTIAVLMLVAMASCSFDFDISIIDEKSEGVMTYAEYIAAEKDSAVVIEAYVQATQGWWEDNGKGVITVYAMDNDGGYFIYNMSCSQEDSERLLAGTKIKVTGVKSEWSGEIEIVDATFEIDESMSCTYDAYDVTDLVGKDNLIDYQNAFVAVKGATVVAYNEAGDAFNYNWDGSGEKGNDLYFTVKVGENTLSLTVESYLCGEDTDVYKAVEGLSVGDVIDIEGFLYWYNGAQPHVTKVTKQG